MFGRLGDLMFWILLAALATASPWKEAMTQQPRVRPPSAVVEHPFTDAELTLAYRMLLTLEEAREAVREHREAQNIARELLRRAQDDPAALARDLGLAEDESPAIGFALSGDLLVILSLLSDSLDAKVAAYRNSSGPADAESEKEWRRRRDELRPLVKERFAEIRASGEP